MSSSVFSGSFYILLKLRSRCLDVRKIRILEIFRISKYVDIQFYTSIGFVGALQEKETFRAAIRLVKVIDIASCE